MRRRSIATIAAEFQYALSFTGLGDKAQSLAQLERMVNLGPVRLGRDLTYPEFALVCGDPRIKLLRKPDSSRNYGPVTRIPSDGGRQLLHPDRRQEWQQSKNSILRICNWAVASDQSLGNLNFLFGLTVSANHSSILYSVVHNDGRNLMLLQNFR